MECILLMTGASYERSGSGKKGLGLAHLCKDEPNNRGVVPFSFWWLAGR
jgi:hypothetical protein